MTNYLIKKFIPNYEDVNNSQVRRKFGVLSGIVGIICNMVLSAGKFFVGIMTSSIAVSADAFNNLSDAVSSIITLICFKTSGSPADKNHPFGYGRIEYISGLIISIAIIFTGIEFTKSSIEKIFNPEPVCYDITSVIILSVSLIVKLWMGFFNRKLGNMINSMAMKATAFDSILDGIITVTILAGMTINYLTGISVDAYTGIIVALFIVFTGVSIIKETINPLLGQSPSPEMVKEINDIVLSSPKILGIHEITVHNYGPGKSVISLHAEMPANENIMVLHEATDLIEKKLKNKFGCPAIIHMDPIITDNKEVTSIRKKLSKIVKLIHKDSKVYDLRIIPGSTPTLIFHTSVPYSVNQTNEEISTAIVQSVKAIDPRYKCIIDIDRVYFNNVSEKSIGELKK